MKTQLKLLEIITCLLIMQFGGNLMKKAHSRVY